MPCGPLNVVAVIKPNTSPDEVEQALSDQQKLPSEYLFRVLNEAIMGLPDTDKNEAA